MDNKKAKLAYKQLMAEKSHYDVMKRYYKGDTDAMRNYLMTNVRSDNKVSVNFIQKFIDEEVSYSVGNDLTYISKNVEDNNVIDDINKHLSSLSQAHNVNLMEKMLIYSKAYELYYIDANSDFNCRVITPSDGHAILDDFGNMKYFAHAFSKEFDKRGYVDIYDDTFIYSYDDTFKELLDKKKHKFSSIPVGIATYNLYEDVRHKTIYGKINKLQDAYETNLSDSTNEISDLRNAYLVLKGMNLEEKDLILMKKESIMQTSDPNAQIEWLIKDIKGTFVKDTLRTLESKMYELTGHINHNENVVSNVSSLAIKARQIGLQQICKLNQKALSDCIKKRLEMLFDYLRLYKSNKDYDYRDIKVVFSDNLPSDDTTTAEMIKKLSGKISLETGLNQLSFVDNAKNEIDRLNKERIEYERQLELAKQTWITESTLTDEDRVDLEVEDILNK